MCCSSDCVRSWFAWSALLALLLMMMMCAQPAFAQPAPSSLDELLKSFSQIQGLRARYVEEKRIALLKMPLRSEGTIAFAAPGSLVRRAEKPEPATLLLDGDVLWVSDASGKRRIDLGESAIVKHFVLTFVNVLRGDHAALARAYALKFATTDAGWTLELTPKAAELRRFVARAVLEGHAATVDRMTLTEENGDVTLMQFSAVDSNVRFDAAERARTFKLESTPARSARETER
jgi:outer membrane lipoprotein-sorting protein